MNTYKTYKPRNITQAQAVARACEEMGDKTEIKVLQQQASVYYGGPIGYQSVVAGRIEYRRSKGIKADCRSYRGQPRRNMLNDQDWTPNQLRRLNTFFKATKSNPRTLIDLIGTGGGQFHSLEQLSNACRDLIDIQSAAA